jgi:hypothetical protein
MKAYQCFSGTYCIHLQKGSKSPTRTEKQRTNGRQNNSIHNNKTDAIIIILLCISISNDRYVISFSMKEDEVVEQTFPLVDFYMPMARFKFLTRKIMHFI